MTDSQVKAEVQPRPVSLQGRIAGAALITTVTVLLVACCVFIFEQWRAERAGQLRHQQELAQTLAVRLSPILEEDRRPFAEAVIDSLVAVPSIRSGELTGPSGRIIARFDRHSVPGPRQDASSPVGVELLLQTRIPILSGDRLLGNLTIASTPPTLNSILPRYLAVCGALFFAATGVALFLGRWLAGRVTEPVGRLSAAMQEVARSGDFARTVQRTGEDELGRLTDTFNALLSRLQANDQALRQTVVELVQARDAAETANVMKSQFLANMSHEIRTPLNGVLAMAQVMAISGMEPEQRERLDVIRRSGETLLTLLNDILDVSKIEAGKLELEPSEFDAGELAGSVHAAFAPIAATKGIDYRLTVHEDAGGVRLGDCDRLRQIVTNLISNAVKFTDAGEVSVELSGLGAGGAEGLRMIVRDSGIGIPAAKLPQLFQKFTQVDSSTTRRYGGTGLGLAICHELAQLMGGRVWGESVEGEGSVFTLELPFRRIRDLSATAAVDEQGLGERDGLLRVLAAEDNATNQLVLSTILGIFGADLTLVADGAAAVAAWREGEYDVILMDIQMPVLDGVGATRAIRAEEAASGRPRIPILALSANAMVHQIKDYMAAGMDGHVAKPIELPKLHAALEAALEPAERRHAA